MLPSSESNWTTDNLNYYLQYVVVSVTLTYYYVTLSPWHNIIIIFMILCHCDNILHQCFHELPGWIWVFIGPGYKLKLHPAVVFLFSPYVHCTLTWYTDYNYSPFEVLVGMTMTLWSFRIVPFNKEDYCPWNMPQAFWIHSCMYIWNHSNQLFKYIHTPMKESFTDHFDFYINLLFVITTANWTKIE